MGADMTAVLAWLADLVRGALTLARWYLTADPA